MPTKSKKSTSKKSSKKIPKPTVVVPPSAPEATPLIHLTRKLIAGVPNGTQDIAPDQMRYWEVIEQALQSIVVTHQFQRITVPTYEATKLIIKGLGPENKVVKEKLIGLAWPTDEEYTLRPELRLGMTRAFAQMELPETNKPYKLYSVGPVYQYQTAPDGENWNQATHINFEIFDSRNAVLDAQLIQIAWKLLQQVGLTEYLVHINSTGCAECRPGYILALKEYYETNASKVCRSCREYIKKNPLRVLDCEEEKCQRVKLDAPQFLDALCQNCNQQLKSTLEYLDEIDIPYELAPTLIGEVDYFMRTVFAIYPNGSLEKNPQTRPAPLFTGGRYNKLIETLGGLPTAAVGITGHMERIVRAMQEQQVKLPQVRRADVYLAQLSERAKKKALEIFEDLRLNGIRVVESFGKNSISKQLEQATELGVRLTLILGQKETQDGTIMLRDMENGVQETVNAAKLVDIVKHRLREEWQPAKAEPSAITETEEEEEEEEAEPLPEQMDI